MGLSEDARAVAMPCLALSLAPRMPGFPLGSTSCSSAPQVPGAFGISIPCLLFIKGMRPRLRNTNGSGSGGERG